MGTGPSWESASVCVGIAPLRSKTLNASFYIMLEFVAFPFAESGCSSVARTGARLRSILVQSRGKLRPGINKQHNLDRIKSGRAQRDLPSS